MGSQITGIMIVCLTVCWGAHKRKHQRSTSLAFVRRIHRWAVVSPRKGPVTWKMFPFDDVKMSGWKDMVEYHLILHIDGLLQDCAISSTLAKEIPQSYTKPSTRENLDETFYALRPRKMDTISQTTFSSAFHWIKMYEFRLKIHWSLFLRV